MNNNCQITPEERDWEIKLVQERNEFLKLSLEQAEKVWEFEKVKQNYSEEYHFSHWEEMDYEHDNFATILDENQLRIFKKWQDENTRNYEKNLIDNEARQLNYIAYHSELIYFYEKKYLPELKNERRLTAQFAVTPHKPKIDYLKNEYNRILHNEKFGAVSSHYRHHRLFSPNVLALTYLKFRLYHVNPNYRLFKFKMDPPMAATANFLLEKFDWVLEQYAGFFNKSQNELTHLINEIRTKYIEESRGQIIIRPTDTEEKEQRLMSVLLMDNEYLK